MTPNPSPIAVAHRSAPPFSSVEPVTDAEMIRIRYDGMSAPEARIFAVINLDDLAKLSEDIIDDVPLAYRLEDGRLVGCRDAFFVEYQEEQSLYLNLDRHEAAVDRIINDAKDRGVRVLNTIGDLRLMTDMHDDMAPPKIPGFMQNDAQNLDPRQALSNLENRRGMNVAYDGPEIN